MIEVILTDMLGVLARAEADEPEAALVAARTLWEDQGGWGYHGRLGLAFIVDGDALCQGLTLTQISGSLAQVAA